MAKADLTAERLREILHYSPETGIFTWRVRISIRVMVNTQAGYISSSDGYRYIGIDGRKYLEQRLAWRWMLGAWPIDQIDHKNRNRTDNRFDNLREATNAQNCQNQSIRKDNTSGTIGVRWCKIRCKWVTQISVDGHVTPLGRFATKEAALAAYVDAKRKFHPFSTL